jgi:outer membrane receptor protein involved in Fe transport
LTPEEIETYELIYEQNLGRSFFGTVSAFDYDYRALQSGDGEIDPDMPYDTWVNDDVRSRGVEAEVDLRRREGITGRASYSFVEAEERYYNPLWHNPGVPKHMAKLNLEFPLSEQGTRLGVEVQYTSKRESILREIAHEYTLINLSLLNESLVEGLTVQGGIYNLFNKRYKHPGTWGEYQEFIHQDGRSFRLFVTYTR